MNTVKVFSEWLQGRLESLESRCCHDGTGHMRQPRFEDTLTRLAVLYADGHFDPSGRHNEGPDSPMALWQQEIRDLPFEDKKKFWQLCFENHLVWLYAQYGLEPPTLTPEEKTERDDIKCI